MQAKIEQFLQENRGVRMTHTGHGHHTVQTCVHRKTEDNVDACFRALAALEGYESELDFIAALEQAYKDDPNVLTVETYRAS